MRRKLTGALCVLGALSLACGSTGPGEATIEVDECSDGADVDETTLIVWEFEESAHEMVTCGSLTFQFMRALIDTASTLLTNPAGLPEAFSYADGVYTTTGEGVAMDLTFRYGPDTPGGEAGETITANLFDLDSYLVDAVAVEDGETIEVSFTEPGPLAPLLGHGAQPESPLVLTEADLAVLAASLASLKIKSTIYVDHEKVVSTITYEIKTPVAFVTDALLGMKLDMRQVDAASGVRDDLGQEMETTTWEVTYGDLAGTLDGVIEADVRGGPFDFRVTYDYSPTARYPNVDITCL